MRMTTEQFMDRLRRSAYASPWIKSTAFGNVHLDEISRIEPLPDVDFIQRGFAVRRQVYRVYYDNATAMFRVDLDRLTLIGFEAEQVQQAVASVRRREFEGRL